MFDKHADEAIEAEIWLKAEAKGREEGREQEREQMALDMLADSEPVEKIVKYSHLSLEKILELKAEMEKIK
jgi:predicted transposase YdaD